MKIVKVEVEKLFGVFDHKIPLMTEENVTIIIGENGLGKTAILEAIDSFFSKRYDFFYDLDFKAFYIHFDNSEIWRLTKKTDTENSLFIGRTTLEKLGQKIRDHKISSQDYSESKKRRLQIMEMRQMELDRLRHRLHNESIWEQTTYEELEYFERRAMVEGRNHRRLMYELRHDSSEIDTPKWFEEGLKKVNVQLIETQRIITLKESDGNSYVNNVKKCAEELSSMIEAAAKRSSEVTLSLDSTYPNRLIKKLKQGTSESFEDLNNALAKLDKRRKIFSSIGLVVDSKDSELLQIKENQKDLIKTLKLYVDDSHQKLDPYEDLSNKIKLFKQIVNKRFKHKKLVISHLNGMEFISTVKTDLKGKAESIPPSKLSSGEQNELILFYKLIFHSKNGDVILIDEPELSLHISWQNKFIKDLKEVTSINDVSIVIATHSPDIIDENWDLKVELLGIE